MLQLRPFITQDADALYLQANNSKVVAYLSQLFPHPYSIADALTFITHTQDCNPVEILAITFNNTVIGAIGVHPQKDLYTKTIELGYWLGEGYWGKGFATQAAALGIAYARQHWQFNRVVAKIFANNIASQKVLLKNGFVQAAVFNNAIYKNGVYYDEYVYCLYVGGF